MLDVLSDMIISAKLDKTEIEKEKGVIVEEINMYEDMQQHKVSQVYDAILYPNHPLGMDIAGTHDTVRSFDRQVFVDYINKLYHPDNSVLVISGGIGDKIKTIRDEVANTFGQWESSSGALKQYDFENYQEVDAKKKYSVFKKNTEQAHFVMGYTTDYGFLDDKKYVLGVLAGILGGGMSSRLFVEIREKRGLCYYVHTSRDMYSETGSLVTSAGVRCDIATVNEALKLIVEEHQNISIGKDKDKLIEEIARVKEMLKGRFLLSLEDSQSVASFYGNKMLLEGKYVDPKEVVQKILDVTIDDVISEAEKVVKDDKLRLAVIGPFDEAQIKI
jgi:predicted Zn-dependent peptidase